MPIPKGIDRDGRGMNVERTKNPGGRDSGGVGGVEGKRGKGDSGQRKGYGERSGVVREGGVGSGFGDGKGSNVSRTPKP